MTNLDSRFDDPILILKILGSGFMFMCVKCHVYAVVISVSKLELQVVAELLS